MLVFNATSAPTYRGKEKLPFTCETCRTLVDFGYRKRLDGSYDIRCFCRQCGEEYSNPIPYRTEDASKIPANLYPLKLPAPRNEAPTGYREYLASKEWAEKRSQIIQRDGCRCRLCNSPAALTVHHRTYERLGHEEEDDLTTLCRKCHAWFHAREKAAALLDFMSEAGFGL